MNLLQPFAGQHAIQSAAFSLEFAKEMDVAELQCLRVAAAELKNDFPKLTDQKLTTISFQIGSGEQDASIPQTAAMDTGGFILDRPSSEQGQVQSLRLIVVSRKSITVVINDYTRWEKFRSDINSYLSILLKSINAQKGVLGISLQIADVFNWRSDPADLNVAEVFSKESKYLMSNVFEPDILFWHSHHGCLLQQALPVNFQQLDNININKTFSTGEHQFQILTSHKVTFQSPLYKFLDVNKEKVFSILDNLHVRNKEILKDVLMPKIQAKINLNGKRK
jgi:uncharacterized protein (TIGR04255 family)